MPQQIAGDATSFNLLSPDQRLLQPRVVLGDKEGFDAFGKIEIRIALVDNLKGPQTQRGACSGRPYRHGPGWRMIGLIPAPGAAEALSPLAVAPTPQHDSRPSAMAAAAPAEVLPSAAIAHVAHSAAAHAMYAQATSIDTPAHSRERAQTGQPPAEGDAALWRNLQWMCSALGPVGAVVPNGVALKLFRVYSLAW